MNEQIIGCIKGITVGDPQVFKNMAICPLAHERPDSRVDYITLSEALEGQLLTVTEVTQGGSVPELKVVNDSDRPVLLLDGEELAGAKQNRVLNTTVLVPGKQSVVIPVSCTEQGRWTYASPTFHESGNVMARSIRSRKNQSVSDSLNASASFRSDQGGVWDGIADLQQATASHSPTQAMRDVYESQKDDLNEALKAFPLQAGQFGFLALINGEAAGLDFVSLAPAFGRLHGKLVKSYIMDALPSRKRRKKVHDPAELVKAAKAFLERTTGCEERVFKSVGSGDDCRFKGPRIAGSALVCGETVIHTAFFQLDQAAEGESQMSGLNRRRSYRV
jgi:hypothetical protein